MRNKIRNLPKKIYLQIDPENEKPEDFKELREVTWCEDRINDSDIEYVIKKTLKRYDTTRANKNNR